MSTTPHDDGGPAFPQNDATVNRVNNHDGMSLRDYFAAKAMQGLVVNEGDAWLVEQVGRDSPVEKRVQAIATASFILADAMLAARKRGAQ